MATVLYARVSTADQTLDHQRTQAEAAGFKLDRVVADHGVSGVSTRLSDRPEGRRLFDILRAGDTLVVRWVDRLGRNYGDVCDSIRQFLSHGVVIRTVINNMTFDGATKDPMQKAVRDALTAFMAATAEAQAEATKQAQRAGIEHARATPLHARSRARSRRRDPIALRPGRHRPPGLRLFFLYQAPAARGRDSMDKVWRESGSAHTPQTWVQISRALNLAAL
jgi:DNA invertase Pin-like site-specific DNA recombinase